MRPATIALLRQFFADTDDPTTDTPPMAGDLPLDPLNDKRLGRLLARALREQQQDINTLAARVAALEAKVP